MTKRHIIRHELKRVDGELFNVVRFYQEGLSRKAYQDEIESYGSEVVYVTKRGNIFNAAFTV